MASYMNENENQQKSVRFFRYVSETQEGGLRFRELQIQYISRISNGQPPSEAHVAGKILSPSSWFLFVPGYVECVVYHLNLQFMNLLL